MKLLILFFLLSFSSLAVKTFTFELTVISEFDGQLLENIDVQIWNEKGDYYSGKTDLKGRVVFENLKIKEFNFQVKDNLNNYNSNWQFIKNKKKQNVTRTIAMDVSNELFMTKCNEITDQFFNEHDSTLVLGELECPDGYAIEASFPGGYSKMLSYINRMIVYPEKSLERNEQGKVYLSFVVETNGSISNIEILRGAALDLDREAKRIIREMPRWIPAQCDGKMVRSNWRLPIIFSLE